VCVDNGLCLEVLHSTNYARELIHFMAELILDLLKCVFVCVRQTVRLSKQQTAKSVKCSPSELQRQTHKTLIARQTNADDCFSSKLRSSVASLERRRNSNANRRAEIIINLPLKVWKHFWVRGIFLFYGTASKFAASKGSKMRHENGDRAAKRETNKREPS
jgi:hypothetical protein